MQESVVEEFQIELKHEQNIFGAFDAYRNLMEKHFHVTMVSRDGVLKIMGQPRDIAGVKTVLNQLIGLSQHGNDITEQQVNYLIDEIKEQEKVDLDRKSVV